MLRMVCFCTVLVAVYIGFVGWLVVRDSENYHDETMEMIQAIRVEIDELKEQLKEHDEKPEWWERE